MTWPMPLPSASRQWVMRTRGCLAQGDAGIHGSSGVVAHGEDVYAWAFAATVPESAYHQMYHLQLYRWVDGLGFERLTGTNRMFDSSLVPSMASVSGGNLTTDPIYWYYSRGSFSSDGRYLYALTGGRVLRIDPAGLGWQAIAGGAAGSGPIDAPVGTSVRIHDPGGWCQAHEGYLYFFDQQLDGRVVFRRTSLTSPYGTETFFESQSASGLGDTDPSTGLPYALRGDRLYLAPSWSGRIHGSYMYVIGNVPCVGDYWPPDPASGDARNGRVSGLFRFPLSDPSQWQLLYYGVDAAAAGTFPRDLTSGYSANDPYVHQSGSSTFESGYPYIGTPDLEGFFPQFGSIAITDSGKLVFQNQVGVGSEPHVETLCCFDISTLAGTVRHNRQQPAYRTIANGTCADESWSRWGIAVDLRSWGYRSGSAPLFPRAAPYGLAARGESVWFLAPLGTGFVVDDDNWLGDDAHTANFLVELAETSATGAAIDVRLKFDGVELKTYSPQGSIQRQDPPEEVFLS